MHTFLSDSLALLERMAHAHGTTLGPAPGPRRARLPSEYFDQACLRLADSIADPAFALHAADVWHPSDFGALGYAWFASSSLRTALQRMVRYRRVVGERGELSLREAESGVWICYSHHRKNPLLNRIGTEIALSVMLALCRRNFGPELSPLAVRLAEALPVQRAPYDAYFGCKVEFAAPESGMLLQHELLDRELPTANQEVAGTLDQLLTQQLARLDHDDFVARCKAQLLKSLTNGLPTAQDVARQLCVSERTLQRRLAERETSFLSLVDQTRHEMALAYLGNGYNSITEVAFLVGFSTPSAFTRAFVRWTGQSPTQWRSRTPVPVSQVA